MNEWSLLGKQVAMRRWRRSGLAGVGLVLALMLTLVGQTRATIVSGATATASSTIIFGGVDETAPHAVDGSGLSLGDNTAVTPDQMHTNSDNFNAWLTQTGDTDPTLTVNLGAVYDKIAGVRIFNYNSPGSFTTRGVRTTRLLQSVDGSTWTTNSLGLFTIPIASGISSDTGTYFAFSGPVQAKFFQFDIQSNWGDATPLYGLSELQFEAVPEPSSVVLLGLGGLVLWRRMRRNKRP